ncbi:hypothetical protein PIB30_032620 [Stylosanthes scabra]|uniref:Uncharacterized protein n=1 Tax=Stylosanthes scabra TaxID=79078 RepID=A0ABU6UBM4_9FABA|nr:hypothetical protein [Stylosanthes scabra]
MTLLLSWAYHRIPVCRPDRFEQRHFSLVERWIGYEPPRDREETRLRDWRRMLNRLGIADNPFQIQSTAQHTLIGRSLVS